MCAESFAEYVARWEARRAKRKEKKEGKSQPRTPLKPVKHPGMRFDSKAEAALYGKLLREQEAGLITDLRSQVHVYLLKDPDFFYIADFEFKRSGVLEYAEFKGPENASWKVNRKLWRHFGPGKLQVYKGDAESFYVVETIIPKSWDLTKGKHK